MGQKKRGEQTEVGDGGGLLLLANRLVVLTQNTVERIWHTQDSQHTQDSHTHDTRQSHTRQSQTRQSQTRQLDAGGRTEVDDGGGLLLANRLVQKRLHALARRPLQEVQ